MCPQPGSSVHLAVLTGKSDYCVLSEERSPWEQEGTWQVMLITLCGSGLSLSLASSDQGSRKGEAAGGVTLPGLDLL
jgi:hypothetical protein